MAPRFSKIMSKMQDEEDIPADIPNPEMMMEEPSTMPWDKPFPPGIAAQEAFDDMLTRRVVDPLAQAGHPDLGAGFAAIPSAAHSMIVPQTEFDVAGTIIPLPGVAKAMKAGKFRKIRNAMKAEDPENVAGIVAKQAEKHVPEADKLAKKEYDEYMKGELAPKAEVRDIDAKVEASKAEAVPKHPQGERLDRIKKSLSKIDDLMKQLKSLPGSVEPPKSELSILERILSRFDEPEAEKLRSVIKRDLDAFEGGNTYIGENFHKPVWQKPNAEYVQPIPVPPEYLDKVGNHVGKNIMYGGNDPFQWLDTKYGASKAWLEKTTGQPRIIETQSDLIAHADYMDKLTDQDKVIFHILGDDNRISRVLMPGVPSQARVIQAAKKLADKGINVTIKRHNIPGRKPDKSSQVIPDGIWQQDEYLRLDPEQIKAISKVGGHDFFNSPVIDADVAPIVNQGKDMARKEYEDIYDFKPRSIPDPPKPPKGDPEASLRFPGIQSQMDVAPSRMDETGKAFGDVGQSEFLPDNRPQVIREDVPKRNYVESEMGKPVSELTGGLKPSQLQNPLFKYSVNPMIDDLKSKAQTRQTYGELSYGEEVKAAKSKHAATRLQNQMYKGRPSHEAEQAKLFPKVNEAVKGRPESVKKLFQKPDGSLVDENGNVVMTAEESERLMYEKLKDF